MNRRDFICPMRDRIAAVLAAVTMLVVATAVQGQESVRHDAPCRSAAAAPLRQSIVILDEAAVAGLEPSAWTRPILEFADALDSGVPNGAMQPGERLSILVVRRDGSDLATVFVGCSPNISQADREARERNAGTLEKFFQGSVAQRLETERKSFSRALTTAFAIPIKWSRQAGGKSGEPGSFLRALQSAPRLVDLANGMPRVLIVSSFDVGVAIPASPRAARELGFEVGAKSGIDLKRAEVYVTAAGAPIEAQTQAFAHGFLLRSRGHLAGWRARGLPPLLNAPVSVSIYGGTVKWADVNAPVLIRIAADAQGELVNSWIEVTTGASKAAPISGKALCRSETSCEIRGDGRLLGQSWNPDGGEKPVFLPDYPWSGLRYFELIETGGAGVVRIWDPSATLLVGGEKAEEFKFSVQRTRAVQF